MSTAQQGKHVLQNVDLGCVSVYEKIICKRGMLLGVHMHAPFRSMHVE